jgi:hypothetical protein
LGDTKREENTFMIRSAHSYAGRPVRRGTVVPLLAMTIVALVAFLALAIDLGMLAVAKAQAQQSADLAALTAARTVNGTSTGNYNQAAATTNAQNILSHNVILAQAIASSQLQLTYGSYDYNQTTQLFNANYPPTSGAPLTAVAATVTATGLAAGFSGIFGNSFLPNVSATAQAVHRPRDVALVMDLSGSMRMGTCLRYDFYTASGVTNNPDTNVPTFGQYSSGSAGLIGPSGNTTSSYDNYTISPSNTTAANSSYSLTFINNFYQNAAYATPLVRAFDSYTSNDSGTTWVAPTTGTPQLPPASYASVPGGDAPLFKNGSSTTYAQNVNDVVGGLARNPAWELDGYSNYVNGSFSATALTGQSSYPSAVSGTTVPGSFSGYTTGPGYYGKTFFVWPPDPRRPLNTGSATAWSTTANDTTAINKFLQDFNYGSATDFTNSAFTTTLNGNINNSTTSITVNSSTPFPIVGLPTTFRIIVESEIMIVTAATASPSKTWTVQRGKDGTLALAHTSGKPVGLVTAPPLLGIYGSTTTLGSQNWPWPPGDDATGTTAGTLSKYLTTQVYIPVSQNATARLLQTTDAVFQKIMRLYNWNYVVENTGLVDSTQAAACDWRIRFFGTNSNAVLFNGSGSLNPPGSSGMCSATQTYNAILTWLTQTNNPFPAQLRAGRIKYYGAIPTAITGSWPSYGGTDQRFWVEFIDHVLGFRQTSSGAYTDISTMVGYGGDFTWGTISRTSPPASKTQYMQYADNPARGKLRFWFSPILMVDSLHNYNMEEQVSGYYYKQAGDTYEAPVYTAKQAFVAAVNTMQTNHPNDWAAVIPYSWPRSASNGTASGGGTYGRFNCASAPLGTNYNYATSALLFPFSTINADGSPNGTEITPYDADPATGLTPSANLVDTPRADGDTCFAMALMLCFNQFAVTPTTDTTLRTFTTSTPITFPTGMAGGLGRKGAQKVIIFETDGMPNCTATATLTSSGAYSYYPIRYDMNRPNSSEYPSVIPYSTDADPAVTSQINSLVTQLKTTYGTSRNPFRLYSIGFGPVFTGADSGSALTVLQNMQYYAGTQSSPTTALPANQIITGTDAQMSANMISAYTGILQNGVQVALIK